MRIGIDISLLCIPKTGIGQYRYNLINALSKINEAELYLYGYNYRWNNIFDDLKFETEIQKDVKKFPNRGMSLLWSFFSRPLLENTVDKCDCYHISETSFQPSNLPAVATVHDLTIEKFPELHLKENKFFASRRHEKIAKSGMPIIAVSEHTKDDFVEHYGIDPNLIKVIYHGKNEIYKPIKNLETINKVLQTYEINKPYFLYIGTLEPRKNISRLIDAFYALKSQENLPHMLVLAGQKGWHYESVFQRIDEYGLKDDVKYIGFVKEEEKPTLMNAAEAFVYPSLYEGFGLPVLEAMACGVPVISSQSSSIPEITGKDGAILVNPKNTEELSSAMLKIVKDRSFAEELAQRGLKRSKDFSWDKCAQETFDFYRNINSQK